jgi:hypothetical protein
MTKTVIGVFRDHTEAQAVVSELRNMGFTEDQISLISSDRSGSTHEANEEAERVDAGTTKGAALGGAAGAVLGLAAMAIPGIGPILAAGPLAVLLAGAGVGAAAGGMLGALTAIGVPDEEAGHYAEAVRRGGTLVVVRTTAQGAEQAESVLSRHGALDIAERVEGWRRGGWRGFDPAAGHTESGEL